MNVLIDVNHPAHVHIFNKFTNKIVVKDIDFLFLARDKDVTIQLLHAMDLPYVVASTSGKSTFSLFYELIQRTFSIIKIGRNFHADLILSCGSPCAAWASRLLSIPHISVIDTEHASLEICLMRYASDAIITPIWFSRDLGPRHIRYSGFHEHTYLNPQAFKPDETLVASYGLSAKKPYSVVRFVGWHASHDIGKRGLSAGDKTKIVETLLEKGPVVLSCEGEPPSGCGKRCIVISPQDMHHVLAFASVYVGEGGTMASEAAMLGTPAIYMNVLSAGVLSEQERCGLLYSVQDPENALQLATALLDDPLNKQMHGLRRDAMLDGHVDVADVILQTMGALMEIRS